MPMKRLLSWRDMARLLLAHLWPHLALRHNYAVRIIFCILSGLYVLNLYFSAHWHRSADGKLQRGIMKRFPGQCTAKFDIYLPNDLSACPRVLVICRNPHSHPPPMPVKTPPPLLDIFTSLLTNMDWKLADATPLKIVLDSNFIYGLRKHLGWSNLFDPALSDLHPSLGNLDHSRRQINLLRNRFFPSGTGLAGAHIEAVYHVFFIESHLCRCRSPGRGT